MYLKSDIGEGLVGEEGGGGGNLQKYTVLLVMYFICARNVRNILGTNVRNSLHATMLRKKNCKIDFQ